MEAFFFQCRPTLASQSSFGSLRSSGQLALVSSLVSPPTAAYHMTSKLTSPGLIAACSILGRPLLGNLPTELKAKHWKLVYDHGKATAPVAALGACASYAYLASHGAYDHYHLRWNDNNIADSGASIQSRVSL